LPMVNVLESTLECTLYIQGEVIVDSGI
jgi:hypothetical protein